MQEAMATFPWLDVLCNRHPMQSPKKKLKLLEHNQKQHQDDPEGIPAPAGGQTSLDRSHQPTKPQPYANRQHPEEDVKRMDGLHPHLHQPRARGRVMTQHWRQPSPALAGPGEKNQPHA